MDVPAAAAITAALVWELFAWGWPCLVLAGSLYWLIWWIRHA